MRRFVLSIVSIMGALVATAAQAATIYTFTGTRAYDHAPFEAIFRFDTPAESFTFTVNGQTVGFDETFMNVWLRRTERSVFIRVTEPYSLDGGAGWTYISGRFSILSFGSHVSNWGQNWIQPLGGELYVHKLAITTAPDLPVGYYDVSGIVPTDGVPEPGAWGLMILGFAAVGTFLRGRGRQLGSRP